VTDDKRMRMRRALERIEAQLAKVKPGDPDSAAYAIGAIAWDAAYGLRGDAAFGETTTVGSNEKGNGT
jgi:hypothetical protein